MGQGGSTHARYGHNCRPRVLQVRCPRCGGRADAEKPSERGLGDLIGDLSPSWALDDWTVTCSRCPHRTTELPYSGLPPLYYRLEHAGTELWAWNRGHLEMLASVLAGKSARGHRYEWLSAHVRGEWLERRRRAAMVKEIHRLLETEAD